MFKFWFLFLLLFAACASALTNCVECAADGSTCSTCASGYAPDASTSVCTGKAKLFKYILCSSPDYQLLKMNTKSRKITIKRSSVTGV